MHNRRPKTNNINNTIFCRRTHCFFMLMVIMIINIFLQYSARADVGPTLTFSPGLGVLIYKSEHDLVCPSCFQFNKPGPSLRVNLLLDLKKKTWGLRIGLIAFGYLAFNSWDDHGVDISSSRWAGVISGGPTYTNREKEFVVFAGISIGASGNGNSSEITNDVGKTIANLGLYGGQIGIRFLSLKPLILDIEPISFFVSKYEQKDTVSQATLKFDLEVFWTPSVHLGYQW